MSAWESGRFTQDELETSMPFDPKRRLGGTGGNALRDRVLSALQDWEPPRQRARRPSDVEHLRTAVDAFLANLLAGVRHRVSTGIFVAMSFDVNYYSGTGLTLRPMKLVRDFLVATDLAEGQQGFNKSIKVEGFPVRTYARRTRLRATPRLVEWMRGAGIELQAPVRAPSSGLAVPLVDIIQITDPKPGLGSEPPEVTASRAVLEEVNRINREADLDLPPDAWTRILQRRSGNTDTQDRLEAGERDKVVLYRKFVRTWDEGGRLYGGWWQNVSKSERRHLTIDGQPTVELDYGRLHPTILYAKSGLSLDFDPYVVPGFDGSSVREVGKRIFNSLLNSRSVRLKPEPQDIEHLGPDIDFDDLVSELRAMHAQIAHAFGTKFSPELQRIDSDIIVEVLRRTTAAGIPTLPIHDSVIVPETEEELVRQAMAEAYRAVLGHEPGPIHRVGKPMT